LRSKSLYNMRLRVPEARVGIMERRRYLTKVKDQEQILGKHLSKLLAEDSPLWKRRRLTRSTVEEEEKCREIARIPSHLFVSSSRREQKRKEEETRKSQALISQEKVHLECHAMTHTKDKPWQCSHCRTRFSKKSSLVRHFQNAHDVVRTNLTEAEDEHTKEAGEYPRSDLTIVSVPDLTTDDTHKNDVGDMNSQFDVEVSFCEDIGDILNVPNDTLFIMDTAEVHSKDSVGNPELSKDADTENLEEIEKFLEESKAEPVPKISKTTKETKEVRISKDNTYRIPKSPKKPATLKPHQQQTPHIPYQKEASLSVVSVGLNSVKRKDATSSTSISKSTLTSPKKLSFEEALNVALAPSSKRERTRPVHKSIKVIKAGPMSSNSFFKQKLCHSQSPASTLSSSSTTSTLQESACDAIRKELQGKKPAGPASEDLSPTKTVSGAGGSCGMVGSRRVDPCTNTNHQDPKTRSRSTEKVKNCHELITKRKEHHSNATKPLKRSPEKATGSEQHLVRGKMDSTAPRPHIGPSQHHQSEMRIPQDKQLLPLNPDFSSPAHTLGHSNRNTSSSSPKEDRRQHVGMVSSQPLSPEAARGLSLTLEMSPKLQASLTSALSSIAANQATGYYTSNAASSEPSRSRSEDVEYGKEDVEKQALTLLPSNFPTFDATSTYSLLHSLQSLSSKPTAVVSPSRPRLPMPLLPKPVPAAINSSPVKVEKVPVLEPGFICRQCPQGFSSRASLLSHQLIDHPWS